MTIENILNNKEYKIFFLRAILLGIDYGSSDKVEYYKKNIQNEIYNILKNNRNISNISNNISNIPNNISKYENNIINLEFQKKNIQNSILKLSSNNYGYNYSRINILKNNLIYLNQEIEKNKLFLQKEKKTKNITTDSKNESIYNKNTQKEYQYNSKDNLVSELEKTLGNLSNLIIN